MDGFCCAANTVPAQIQRGDQSLLPWVMYWILKATAGVVLLHMLQAKNVTSAYRLGKEYTAFDPI